MSESTATTPFSALTRRRFVGLMLGAVAAVAAVPGGLWMLRGQAPHIPGLKRLSDHEFRTLTALARVHVPGATPDIAHAFDGFLDAEPEANVRDLKRALTLLEFGPVVFERRARTFSNLPPDQRVEHWKSWMWSERHIQRKVATAFRKFLSLVFYDHPDRWPDIGYPGPSFHGMPGSRPPLPHPPSPQGVVDCGKTMPPDNQLFDVVVVGSGAAGGTVAWELAAAGQKVLVIEEGADRTGAALTQRDGEMYDQLYMDRAGRMSKDLSITVLAGRALGGGTVINASDVVPIPEAVLHHWADRFGIPDWGPSDIRPFAERALTDLSAGPIPDGMINAANHKLLAGATGLGIEAHAMMHNRVGCGGMGTCLIGCPLNAKRNTRIVAIPQALKHGASVYCRARVVHIDRADQDVKVLTVRSLDAKGYHETGEFTVRAGRVVLAANAMGSAGLLLRSGIGNAHVGQHFSLQPQLPVIARFPEPIRGFRGIPQAVAVTEYEREEHENGLWGFRIEAIMGTPGIVASLLPWPGSKGADMMRHYERIAASLLLTPDLPTGRVEVTPDGRVAIDYTIADDLRVRWREAVKAAAAVYFEAGATEVIVPTMPPVVMTSLADADQIDDFAFAPATAPLISAHQQGGVRMATSAKDGAADPSGLVYGTKGVYCFDSGLYPSSASSHTMTPIITTSRMLARRMV